MTGEPTQLILPRPESLCHQTDLHFLSSPSPPACRTSAWETPSLGLPKRSARTVDRTGRRRIPRVSFSFHSTCQKPLKRQWEALLRATLTFPTPYRHNQAARVHELEFLSRRLVCVVSTRPLVPSCHTWTAGQRSNDISSWDYDLTTGCSSGTLFFDVHHCDQMVAATVYSVHFWIPDRDGLKSEQLGN